MGVPRRPASKFTVPLVRYQYHPLGRGYGDCSISCMPPLFALMLSFATLIVEPAPPTTVALMSPAPRVQEDPLGDLASIFDGVPVPVVDPFQVQVMVEIHGSF